MIEQNPIASKYGPFRVGLVFSFIMLTLCIVFFILSRHYCSQTNCNAYGSYAIPCFSNGALYCCNGSGFYSCGQYFSCQLDNMACGGMTIGSWVTGSFFVLSIIANCLAVRKFKKMRELALLNIQNNGQWGSISQDYNNPPIYYPNQQNHNRQYTNQYQNNQYQDSQNQAEYVPPTYDPQN